MHPLVKAVRGLAKEYSDAIYKEDVCLYTRGHCGGGEGCLIGQAIQKVYPEDKESLIEQDDHSECDITEVNSNLDFGLTDRELYWLLAVQKLQDRGFCWSKAVELADKQKEL